MLQIKRLLYITAHKMKFSVKDFFSICNHGFLHTDLFKFAKEILNGFLRCSKR